jgi:hypothetical protein
MCIGDGFFAYLQVQLQFHVYQRLYFIQSIVYNSTKFDVMSLLVGHVNSMLNEKIVNIASS